MISGNYFHRRNYLVESRKMFSSKEKLNLEILPSTTHLSLTYSPHPRPVVIVLLTAVTTGGRKNTSIFVSKRAALSI
jgi:hypothetical protein